MSETRTFVLTEEHPAGRLDKLLTEEYPDLSRTRVKALILEEQVLVDNVPQLNPSTRLKPGQSISIHLPEASEEGLPEAQALPLTIVFEDEHILVLNKPPGLVVHPAPGNRDKTLVNALLSHCGDQLSGISGVKRPGIVHRLDKNTSGLLVVAKNDQAHQKLSAQFADRSLSRKYKALIWGLMNPLAGEIEGNIGRHPHHRKKMALVEAGGKSARTHYQTLNVFGSLASLVECSLESGRTHQIRVHFSASRHPVVGDTLYCRSRSVENKDLKEALRVFHEETERHALHAYEMRLVHPETEELMHFSAEMPEDMKTLLNAFESLSCRG